MRPVKRSSIFLFIAALLFASGCASLSRKSFSPLSTKYPSGRDSSEISEVLRGRHNPIANLWASGKITISGRNVKGKKSFQATILYQAPDSLRLRGSRMITSTLFEFIIVSGNMALVLNQDKAWFEGAKDEWVERPEVSLGIDPHFLPTALLIHQELNGLFENKMISRWRGGGEKSFFLSDGARGTHKAFVVGNEDLLVREAALYSPGGRLSVRLRFLRYDIFDGELLPAEIEAFFPQTSITALARIDAYKYPESFDSAVFSLTPSPGYERYSLRSLLSTPLTSVP